VDEADALLAAEYFADFGGDAFSVVYDRMKTGGVQAVDLVRALIEAAPKQSDLWSIGAGPMEDLVRAHGDELVDLLVGSADRDPRFAEALSCVWVKRETLRPTTAQRLSQYLPDLAGN
jgi:hypothetical protein